MYSRYKREPDMEELWQQLKSIFEQGVVFKEVQPLEIDLADKNPVWIKKTEDQFLADVEKNY